MSFIDDDDAIVVVGFVHCPLAAINTLTFISSFKHALTHSNLNIYIRRSTTITTSNSSTMWVQRRCSWFCKWNCNIFFPERLCFLRQWTVCIEWNCLATHQFWCESLKMILFRITRLHKSNNQNGIRWWWQREEISSIAAHFHMDCEWWNCIYYASISMRRDCNCDANTPVVI